MQDENYIFSTKQMGHWQLVSLLMDSGAQLLFPLYDITYIILVIAKLMCIAKLLVRDFLNMSLFKALSGIYSVFRS